MSCHSPSRVRVSRKAAYGGPLAHTSWTQTVGCGNCLGCRLDQGRDWTLRLWHEAITSRYASFVTLTYDDEHLPANYSLEPKHLREFIKRLRDSYRRETYEDGSPVRITYYAVGEYGSTTKRPHYHAVIFGAPLLDRVPADCSRPVWQSPTIERAWRYGWSEFDAVTVASVAYVAGYVRKKVSARMAPDYYTRVDPATGELIDLVPEFARMSRRPVLGSRWLKRFWSDVYPADRVVMNGKEYRPPRAYDRWMDEHHPEVMNAVRDKRYENLPELTNQELRAKARTAEARVGLFQPRRKV